MEKSQEMNSKTRLIRRGTSRVAAVALLFTLSISFVACGGDSEPKKSGQFKMNQSEWYCKGYKEKSPGDANLLPGDFYWVGTAGQECPR